MQTKFLYKSSAPGSVTVLWREENLSKTKENLHIPMWMTSVELAHLA